MELYSYDEALRRPTQFGQDGAGKHCVRNTTNRSWAADDTPLHGPFTFAKGPLYFVSRGLVLSLLGANWLRSDLNATLHSISDKGHRQRLPPDAPEPMVAAARAAAPTVWEDVYTGYALSRLIPPATGLSLVENGVGNGSPNPHYSDGFGMQLAPSTVIWHQRTKWRSAYRVAYAHHWAEVEGHHCAPPLARKSVRCGHMHERAMTTSCTGALWLRCTTVRALYEGIGGNCSTTLSELKHLSKVWLDKRITLGAKGNAKGHGWRAERDGASIVAAANEGREAQLS